MVLRGRAGPGFLKGHSYQPTAPAPRNGYRRLVSAPLGVLLAGPGMRLDLQGRDEVEPDEIPSPPCLALPPPQVGIR